MWNKLFLWKIFSNTNYFQQTYKTYKELIFLCLEHILLQGSILFSFIK